MLDFVNHFRKDSEMGGFIPWQRVFFVLLLALVFQGCSEAGQDRAEDDKKETAGTDQKPEKRDKSSSGERKAYPMPTPLQVTSFLKSRGVEYEPSFLLPVREEIPYPTTFQRALVLGATTIDMGFSAVYGDKERARAYLERTRALIERLGVQMENKEQIMERFRSNIQNPDSLSKIVLEVYHGAFRYLREHDKEREGLLVLTGCYMEGLYLTCQFRDTVRNGAAYANVIGQQKTYLENIRRITERVVAEGHQKDRELYQGLEGLSDAFGGVSVSSSGGSEGKEMRTRIERGAVRELKERIEELRTRFFKSGAR